MTTEPRGFTADDLDHLPGLPAHTELIDGHLVPAGPRTSLRTRLTDLLVVSLRRSVPRDLRVRREMSVVLGRDQRPEPDVCVIRAEADTSPEQTFYHAQDVTLVVEVVSPESRTRDRDRKPVLYAEAGIPHFWRVESDSGRPVVYVHELDPPTRSYVPTGIYHDRLKVTVPFDIDLDLTEIDTF
ncbi:Uma2 family endonuclease [Nonomuraea sp. NPDC049725]|uniref:Uma2 family endonuclease n=1 Tax=Nonomuraea sp. NPDC049725 TaxID=3154508 RepID=UPI0034327B10